MLHFWHKRISIAALIRVNTVIMVCIMPFCLVAGQLWNKSYRKLIIIKMEVIWNSLIWAWKRKQTITKTSFTRHVFPWAFSRDFRTTIFSWWFRLEPKDHQSTAYRFRVCWDRLNWRGVARLLCSVEDLCHHFCLMTLAPGLVGLWMDGSWLELGRRSIFFIAWLEERYNFTKYGDKLQ